MHFSFPGVYKDKSWNEYYLTFIIWIFTDCWLCREALLYMLFEIAAMGYNIILYILRLETYQSPWLPPVKPNTHKQTYKHKLNPLSRSSRPQIALSIICPWKPLLLHQHTSFLGHAFCHFTAAIHLPSPLIALSGSRSSSTQRYSAAFWVPLLKWRQWFLAN